MLGSDVARDSLAARAVGAEPILTFDCTLHVFLGGIFPCGDQIRHRFGVKASIQHV